MLSPKRLWSGNCTAVQARPSSSMCNASLVQCYMGRRNRNNDEDCIDQSLRFGRTYATQGCCALESLNHWKGADRISLKCARFQWASLSNMARSSIGRMERKQDRITLARYELTGGFGFSNGESPACGNTIMFCCPDDTPQLAREEIVFSANAGRPFFLCFLHETRLLKQHRCTQWNGFPSFHTGQITKW